MFNQQEFDKRYKEVLIDTFEVFIKFLESKNLRYFGAGGTALGTVRHNNIIPWDDDIDLFMPREDYEKLKQYRSELPVNFSLVFPEDNDSTALYAKFVNNNTTFWEFEQLPYIYGIFIDLFPLDETNQTKDEFIKSFKQIHRLRQYYLLSSYKFSLRKLIDIKANANKKMFFVNLLSLLFPRYMRPFYRKKFLKIEESIKSCKNGVMYGDYVGSYYAKEYLPKDWFAGNIRMPFDKLTITMPNGYENYLKYVYGDYMILPPIEKQVPEHNHFYVNLSKRLSKEEALERIKQGYNHEI